MLYGHRVGTNKFERIHKLLRYTLSSSSVAMCVWSSFANLSIFVDHVFSATQFQHGFPEPCITNEPIVNAQELSFLTLHLELIRSVGILITFFLSVPMTVWSALPDVKVRDREEIKNGLDVLLVFCRIIS